MLWIDLPAGSWVPGKPEGHHKRRPVLLQRRLRPDAGNPISGLSLIAPRRIQCHSREGFRLCG
jgi:hypothetical protein